MNSVGKNIVICCDGTGNDYSRTPSNVWRLRELLQGCRGEQHVCYEPGIGTLDFTEGRTALGRRLRHWRELGFGTGIFERVAALYIYLMREYEPGDRIFLFGFSRGAFTARALAGMLHACGLLEQEAEHLLPYALGLYRTSEQRIQHALRCQGLREAPRGKDHVEWDERIVTFKKALSRECQVHFMGLWDTVKAYGWIWPQSFPALRHNSSVRMVRHAVALDERRAVFQVTGWGDRRRIKARDGSCIDAVQRCGLPAITPTSGAATLRATAVLPTRRSSGCLVKPHIKSCCCPRAISRSRRFRRCSTAHGMRGRLPLAI